MPTHEELEWERTHPWGGVREVYRPPVKPRAKARRSYLANEACTPKTPGPDDRVFSSMYRVIKQLPLGRWKQTSAAAYLVNWMDFGFEVQLRKRNECFGKQPDCSNLHFGEEPPYNTRAVYYVTLKVTDDVHHLLAHYVQQGLRPPYEPGDKPAARQELFGVYASIPYRKYLKRQKQAKMQRNLEMRAVEQSRKKLEKLLEVM